MSGTARSGNDKELTNQRITICLEGGAVLGPFRVLWSKDTVSDVRELVKDFDAFLGGEGQRRFKYHLHDRDENVSHTLVLDFKRITAIYDKVDLHD